MLVLKPSWKGGQSFRFRRLCPFRRRWQVAGLWHVRMDVMMYIASILPSSGVIEWIRDSVACVDRTGVHQSWTLSMNWRPYLDDLGYGLCLWFPVKHWVSWQDNVRDFNTSLNSVSSSIFSWMSLKNVGSTTERGVAIGRCENIELKFNI